MTRAGLPAAVAVALVALAGACGPAPASRDVASGGRSADREPPPVVAPVEIDGVRYEAIQDGLSRGLDREGGYIAAVDPASGRQLWTLEVYTYPVDPARESDVQDVFIESLRPGPTPGTLEVRNEDDRVFVVDPTTRSVRPR